MKNKFKTSTKIILSLFIAILSTIIMYIKMRGGIIDTYPWMLPLTFILGFGLGMLFCNSDKLKKRKAARVLRIIGAWLSNIFYFLLLPGCFLIIPLMKTIEQPNSVFLQQVTDNLNLVFTTVNKTIMQLITIAYNYGGKPNATLFIGIGFVILLGLTIWLSISEHKKILKEKQ